MDQFAHQEPIQECETRDSRFGLRKFVTARTDEAVRLMALMSL
jgi:hypothetical protein